MSVARLPRGGAFARLFLVLLLLAISAASADAQTCTLTVNAPPSACTNTMVGASVQPAAGGQSWASVSWTITGGYFNSASGPSPTATGSSVFLQADGTGPVTLTVRATDMLGCTTPDVVTQVPVFDVLPVIMAPTEVCAYRSESASIAPPAAGSWTNVVWSIYGGTFRDQYGNPTNNASGESVMFEASNTGPVELYASTQHSSGCPTPQVSAIVNLRSIAAPVITAPAQVCPYTLASASVSEPAEGEWQNISWSISGGSLVDQYGNRTQYLSGQPSVMFESNSTTGPVTLYASAQDSFGCLAPIASVQVAMRTIPAPVITAPSQVCPYTLASASVSEPAEGEWQNISWSISGGWLVDQYGNRTQYLSGQPSVMFESNSTSGPVTLYASAHDSFGCMAPLASVQVAMRTIPAPVITAPSQVCPYTLASASVSEPAEGEWQNISWSISGGWLVDQYGNRTQYLSGQPSVMFESNSTSGPVTLYASAHDSFGCMAPLASVQVAMRTIPAPVITAPAQVCPYTLASASVSEPAEGEWQNVSWSISGGSLVDQYGNRTQYLSGQPTVMFESNSTSGPVTLYVTAHDSFGCMSPIAQAQVTIRTITAPVIVAPASVCAYQQATASVEPPAEGAWATMYWSISGGSFRDQWGYPSTTLSNGGEPVTFEANGGGPVTITATGTDDAGCMAPEGTVQVAMTQLPEPVINVNTENLCLYTVRGATIEGAWAGAAWSITGGSIASSSSGTSIGFYLEEQTATLTVWAWDDSGCTTTASRVITATTLPPPQISFTPPVCEGATSIATVTNGENYPWIEWTISANGSLPYSRYGTSVAFVANGEVTLTATPGGGCSTPTSVTIPVQANPPATITASEPGPYCPGTEVTLTASEGTSYLWSTGATTRTIVVSGAGTFSVAVTTAAGCSRSASIQTSLHSIPEVTIVASGPTHICEGGTVVLTATEFAGASYLWSNGATTRSITVSEAGSYNVTTTFSTGCTATATAVNVTVEPAPEAVISTWMDQAPVICNGNPIRLVASEGADAYLWSTGATTYDLLVSQPGTYTVTVTKNGCSKTSAPVTVTAGTIPTTDPYPADWSLDVCPFGTGTTSLTNPGAFSRIRWWIENGTIVGPDDQPTVTFTANDADTTLYVLGYSETGCARGMPVSINVGPPSSEFGTNERMCSDQQATAYIEYGGRPGVDYQWSITNGTILSYGTGNTTMTYRPDGPGTVTITTTASKGGCSSTTTHSVQVGVLEQPVINAPATVCTPTGHTASVTPVAGATYYWSITGGVLTSSRYASSVTFDVFNNSPTTARLSVSVNGEVCSRGDTADVVYNVTEATVFAGNTVICPGGSVTLSSPQAASWLWSNGATTRFIIVTEPGDYFVTTTSATGCSATSAPVTVTADTPAAPVISLSPTEVCPTQEFVTATVTNASDYVDIDWFTSGSPQGTIFGTPTLTIRRAVGNHVYWMEAVGTTANGCQVRTRVEIPVVPGPDTTITTSPSAERFCQNSTYYISVPDAGPGATYSWDVSTATIIRGASTRTVYIQPLVYNNNPVTAICTITDARGCTVYAYKQFPVTPTPQATITAPTEMCVGTTQTASVPDNGPNATYQWWATGGTVISGQGTRSITFQATEGNGQVYLQAVITVDGCQGADSHYVQKTQYYSQTFISGGAPTTFCEGGSVTLLAPDVNAQYLWSNGATTRSITVTESGTYTHQLIYPGGCVAPTTNPITVTVIPAPEAPEVTASGPTTFCEGRNVTLTAPVSPSYLWSNGATTQSIIVAESGSYTVTVTNDAGCTATSSPVPVVVEPAGTVSISNYGPTTFCEGGSVLLVASSNLGNNYLWSNGATTQSITATQAGSYSVTVTNDDGCISRSVPVVVVVEQVPATPTITAGGPTTFCNGGSVTLTASEGVSYLWSNGETTRSIAANATGDYTVTVTNAAGCSATSAATAVTANPYSAAEITAGGPTTFCTGGSVTLTASAGSSWLWSTGATSQSIIVSTSGSYTVAIANAAGCSATSAATAVTVNDNPVATISAAGPTEFCTGGSVVLTASAGASYLWSTGETSQSITVGTSGSYTVTVTNAAGCSATSAATAVTANANPVATINASGPTTFCTGGSVTLTASSGSSWLWSTGETSQSIAVNASGNYSVTVTNAAGCSTTSAATAVTVTDNPVATITPTGSTTFCTGGSVVLTASAGASWLWSNGETTQSITVSTADNYSVTVTNAAGCTATSAATPVIVNANPVATITPTGSTTFCTGGSVVLTASAGASWLWSNGETTQSITVSTADNYTVTVTNAAGCSATSAATPVIVNANPVATITPTGSTTFCTGGSVVLTASAGASWLWSNGETTQSITVTTADNYTVTVTNAAGCSATSAATPVIVNANPIATITPTGSTTFCTGGSVVLTASAGASWLWSNGETTQSITVTTADNYTVTVTNAAGCTATSAATPVIVNANPIATITPTGSTTFCTGGSVVLTASAGASWLWSNGETTQSITVSTADNYTVTVTNAAGCSATSAATPVIVNANPVATITPTGSTTFCTGGSVILTASAGASWLWSNGETTQSITVSTADNYTVTVTNAAGCSATSAATPVIVNANPVATITPTGSTTFCTGGSVILTASAGASWLWSNGETTQSITVSTADNYSVTVTNAAGCTATSAATPVIVNANPVATITPTGSTTFCTGGSVVLTASAGASWLWSNGETTQSITVSTADNYTVTVTNAAGCSATSAATPVIVNANPVATITPTGSTTFCTGGSVVLTASAGASWLWSNGETTQSITVSTADNYTVTVTNAAGCSATSAATPVIVNANPVATMTPTGSTTFCTGGSVILTASAGASWLWSNGETTQSITVSTADNYTVTVTNAAGCSVTSAATPVIVNANPVATITPTGSTTFCTGGSVVLTASAGASWLWSNGETTQSITVSTADNYTVTVTNAAGCSTTSAATPVIVNANPIATITPTGSTTFCTGGSVVLTASGGASWLWSNGETTQSITVSTADNYTVTVTNAAGCSTTSAATPVIVNANPVATITATGSTTFCTGGSVVLTASAGASWLWSNGETTQSITVSTADNYTVTVTNAAGCTATSAATPVIVNANPIATITPTGSTTFCTGGSVVLAASAGASWLWSNGETTQSITVSTADNYTVTVTNAAGCSVTSAATPVIVNANPVATITPTGSTTFCTGGSVVLTASAGASWLWSNGEITQSITVTEADDYTVTVTNAAGCSTTSPATTVTVNAKPIATITPTGSTTFCTGGSVILTASAGASWLWSNGEITQSITVTEADDYTVTVTNAAGCSATSPATTVTVNAKPIATITNTGSTTFCTGGSVILTASAGASWLWSNGEITQSITVSTADNYTVTVTNAAGCSATSPATTVTVNAKPVATITATGPLSFCTGGSVILTASAGASWLWSNGETTQSITVTEADDYTVTVTNAAGCSATSAATTVTVNAKPVAEINANGPLSFCAGGSVILTASAGASWLWSNGEITQSITVSSTDNYSVIVTNAAGCSTTSAATAVTVTPLPAVPVITPTGSTALCPGASVTLTAPAGYASYSWSNGQTSPSIIVNTPGPYTVTVTNAGGCSRTSATTTVTPNAATVITTQPASITMPRNVTRTLSVTATGTDTLQYQWYSGLSGDTSSPITVGGNASMLTIGAFTKKGTHRYWVRVTSSTCTSSSVNSVTATVTVN